ncbi:Cell fate regulator YaaT, PSP1 superfamily (controls sporulation, competence, biofilm development) [Tenacibaculum sp. MAR_2010_89]|uniref:regulatory iron-sulfur-containing complex subunit RicT n=1 Tax=Tenacibaculum sp. MAR_2010_89 TaxID=1250198 RepID=UPI000896C478|nr:regulatory iron-sulfur-containing complex subunit RicT [Tenacibaculum sp. MAR_2010_89]SEE03193.1 Cell fate regulator YaaT, PSP1 superfamily (controls sporulation, competence, biofilm development) [Tenacibaculum sp. MAR_2010_89]
MSCSGCSTNKDGVPKGCKSNGNCATGSCGSGNKLAVFDWLSNMTLPTGEAPFNIYEVRFKNGRKHFYKNLEKLTISMGDIVAVEGTSGHDVGIVSLAGELVKVQMKKRKIESDGEEVKKIYRKASQKDIDVWHNARQREQETQRKGREIISKLGLKMKLSDVEYQGDGTKATFYYTADDRVDFRQLIRDLASAFSIRVEMRQVGMRQEAARLGGIGSCGRELCCSTWLTDFRKVNTAAARYQQLSLNPLKLAGQCGKLKCCLNFELDTYLDALKKFPKQDLVLKTEKGDAVFVKMDIFKGLLWYTYKEESFKWYRISLEQTQEIIELNANNELASPLEEYESEIVEEPKVDFENVVGQDSLTRFDAPKKPRRNKRRGKRISNNKAKENKTNVSRPNKTVADNQKTDSRKPRSNRPKNNNKSKVGEVKQKPNPNQQKRAQGIKPKGEVKKNPNQQKSTQGAKPKGGVKKNPNQQKRTQGAKPKDEIKKNPNQQKRTQGPKPRGENPNQQKKTTGNKPNNQRRRNNNKKGNNNGNKNAEDNK